MDKVEITDSCWNWTGERSSARGDGIFHFGPNKLRAHRVSWMFETGESPTGRYITQTCGNKACVNPAHLTSKQLDRAQSAQDG
jgi:hypothetical protein